MRKLGSLVIAERVVLLYAASGAGKTSLLNAGLTPRLVQREDFEVFPGARVRLAEDPPRGASNVFVASVLTNWATEGGDARPLTPVEAPDGTAAPRLAKVERRAAARAGAHRLASASLADYLSERAHPKTAHGFLAPRLVVLDQTEELFTAYPEHWRHREAFFKQIAAAIEQDPLLHVIIALREDFLAELDPYSAALPGGLRARFRLERLGPEAALRAVTGPLRETARRFGPGVAEMLVDDLITFRVDTGTGDSRQVPGEFVEPVQLQVVCQDLWSNLPDDVEEITEDHLHRLAVVDTALSHFYETAIEAAARRAGLDRLALSLQFEELFITPMGTRGTVLRASGSTGGIPNEAIDELETRHLIRAEWSRGARWYELTHDRMVEPIRDRNHGQLEDPARLSTDEHDTARQASSALARAEELRVAGDLEEALAWAGRAHDVSAKLGADHPALADAVFKESEILFEMQQLDEARDRMDDALRRYANLGDTAAEGDVWRAIGVVERARGNGGDAVDALDRASALYQRGGKLHRTVGTLDLLGQLQLELGELDAGAARLDEAVRIAREIGDRHGEANVRTSLAYHAYQGGDYDAALADTRHALDLFQELGNRGAEATLYLNLGFVERMGGTVDAAVAAWTRAHAIFRELGDHAMATSALIGVIDTYMALGQANTAAALAEQGLGDTPDDVELLDRSATALWYDGRLRDALDAFDRVLELQPQHRARSARGQILATVERYEEALRDLDDALEHFGNGEILLASARSARGLALAGTGDIEAGLAELDRAIDDAPGNAWTYYRRALVHEGAGDRTGAERDLRQSLAADGPPLPGWMADDAKLRLRRMGARDEPAAGRRRWFSRSQ